MIINNGENIFDILINEIVGVKVMYDKEQDFFTMFGKDLNATEKEYLLSLGYSVELSPSEQNADIKEYIQSVLDLIPET